MTATNAGLELLERIQRQDLDGLKKGGLASLLARVEKPATLWSCCDSEGRTPLLCAVETGNADLVVFLASKGAPVDGVGRGADQQAPILVAAWAGDDVVVLALVDAGANLSAKDAHGRNILHACVASQSAALAEELLETKTPVVLPLVAQADRDGVTPLHLLCSEAPTSAPLGSLLDAVVRRGDGQARAAMFAAKTNDDGATPLHLFLRCSTPPGDGGGTDEAVAARLRRLLESAVVNKNAAVVAVADGAGDTLLHTAVHNGLAECIAVLSATCGWSSSAETFADFAFGVIEKNGARSLLKAATTLPREECTAVVLALKGAGYQPRPESLECLRQVRAPHLRAIVEQEWKEVSFDGPAAHDESSGDGIEEGAAPAKGDYSGRGGAEERRQVAAEAARTTATRPLRKPPKGKTSTWNVLMTFVIFLLFFVPLLRAVLADRGVV